MFVLVGISVVFLPRLICTTKSAASSIPLMIGWGERGSGILCLRIVTVITFNSFISIRDNGPLFFFLLQKYNRHKITPTKNKTNLRLLGFHEKTKSKPTWPVNRKPNLKNCKRAASTVSYFLVRKSAGVPTVIKTVIYSR